VQGLLPVDQDLEVNRDQHGHKVSHYCAVVGESDCSGSTWKLILVAEGSLNRNENSKLKCGAQDPPETNICALNTDPGVVVNMSNFVHHENESQ